MKVTLLSRYGKSMPGDVVDIPEETAREMFMHAGCTCEKFVAEAEKKAIAEMTEDEINKEFEFHNQKAKEHTEMANQYRNYQKMKGKIEKTEKTEKNNNKDD